MSSLHSICLTIESLKLEVAWGLKEKQIIDIDLVVCFPKAPLVCFSDDIKDSISHEKCIQLLQEASQKKSFCTLQHLACELHQALKKELPMYVEISVCTSMLCASRKLSFTYFPKKEEEKRKTTLWEE